LDPQSSFQQLKAAFEKHEAVCEERWKSMFNELRDYKDESRERNNEIRESVEALHSLVWRVGGAAILFLLGVLVSGVIQ
jgi:hypothetical protein